MVFALSSIYSSSSLVVALPLVDGESVDESESMLEKMSGTTVDPAHDSPAAVPIEIGGIESGAAGSRRKKTNFSGVIMISLFFLLLIGLFRPVVVCALQPANTAIRSGRSGSYLTNMNMEYSLHYYSPVSRRYRCPSKSRSLSSSTLQARTGNEEGTAGATTTSSTNTNATPVGRVVRQGMILDGAEWISVRNRLLLQLAQSNDPPPAYARTVQGVFTAVTGSVQGRRVVGMQVMNSEYLTSPDDGVGLDQDSSIQLYKESITHIPRGISEDIAAWTLLQSLSIVHCTLPVVPNVGGSEDSEMVKEGRVAIIGSNPLALTAASALSKLGHTVTIVAAKRPKNCPNGIAHMTPAVGELELGFAAVMGQFDALLDTLGDEHDDMPGLKGGLTGLLAQRHGCHTYTSSLTESQAMVTDRGILFGPGQTKDHIEKLRKRSSKATATQFPAPVGLGRTIESLLETGYTIGATADARSGEVYVTLTS